MYDDSYDRRDSKRLSYITSPLSETISTPSASRDHAKSFGSRHPQPLPIRTSSIGNKRNGQDRLSPVDQPSSPDQETGDGLSKGLRRAASTKTAPNSMPLKDIDYRSDPATITQELNNLAALRRMSMDIGSADPDLPFNGGSNFNVPALAPKGSADEDDTSRLFWVPAHLHPGLAPNEFKSFMDSKLERIKRTSGDFSSTDYGSLQRQLSSGGSGGGLQRKKSMLSRQVHPSDSNSKLDTVTEETSGSRLRESTTSNFADEDIPILPLAPPGQNSLRRSTRTTYRKGSFRAGERVPSSRRAPRNFASSVDESRRVAASSEEPPILGLTRVSTDTTDERQRYNRSATRTRQSASDINPTETSRAQDKPDIVSPERTNVNGKSSTAVPPVQPEPGPSAQPYIPRRTSSHDPPPSSPPQIPLPAEPTAARDSKRQPVVPTTSKDSSSNESVSSQATVPDPGNNKKTDLLSLIPTLTEEKKAEPKKSKSKKEESGRKPSWHSWRRFTEDKDKPKSDHKKKNKISKSTDKIHDNTRLDVLQTSIDGGAKGRESLVLDRSDVVIDDDEETATKEKEKSWVPSFLGGKKKGQDKGSHKKTRVRSPEPMLYQPRPDIDYPYSRFPQQHERAIYRMAHLKLANPRRPLRSQVLLSNFMYSYLAMVQQLHPHMVAQDQRGQQDQHDEYSQYHRYQEVGSVTVFQ